MSNAEDDLLPAESQTDSAATPRARWKRSLLATLVLLSAVFAYVWFTREDIADNIIASQLDQLGLQASYTVEAIGPAEQVLTNVVIGDPKRPDLSIERISVAIAAPYGIPRIGRITLEKPRLFGVWRDGRASFGSLDPLIYTGSEEPFRLPDLDLAVRDGRALFESAHGPIGLKLAGEGRLPSGFAGEIAATAPRLAAGDCVAARASLYGDLLVVSEKPRFSGPLRLGSLACVQSGLALGPLRVMAEITADQALDGGDGSASLALGPSVLAETRLAAAEGDLRATFRGGALRARYTLSGTDLTAPQARARRIAVDGQVRATGGLTRLDAEASVEGEGIEPGAALDEALALAENAGEGTLVAPLVAKLRGAIGREAKGARLAGDVRLRRGSDGISVVVPGLALRSASGSALLSVSRFQALFAGGQTPRITGNFSTGGPGLPQISGRMEQEPGAPLTMRLRMAEYRAGTARLELPELRIAQAPGGALGFAGGLRMSGDLPGGRIENLALPLDGNWSAKGGFTLWRACTALRFDRLELADLALDARSLAVCPRRAGAILTSGQGGFAVAGGVSALDFSGRLGGSPLRLASGPVGFAWPGHLTAQAIDVSFGSDGNAARFSVAQFDARLERGAEGRFSGAQARLDAVPLDLTEASGAWRFADGALAIEDGAFQLVDREADRRFEPLRARDARISLAGNAITAEAVLREPASDRPVLRTAIGHDLGSSAGRADMVVDSLLFDEAVQPEALTRYALGVIANTKGTVTGRGRIEWNPKGVSSEGVFATDSLDFAAAFGPVEGVAGTVRFTDLLGLVTAPDQTLSIAAINPGIVVNDGRVTFAIAPDYRVKIDGAAWPFLGGTLTLEPVAMQIGSSDPLRYTLTLEGVDAGRFVQQMDLGNLNATGTFDGTLPLTFDENGGHIRGGMLKSRSPGGAVSYVGELTYEDLSAMANFAFDALRALNYREMTVLLDGDIDGEIVSRVRFAGISQGEGATVNFLTRRIARLPLQFNVNVRAPFYQLITSFKGLYDPGYVRDPRSLGLMDSEGAPVPRPVPSLDALAPPFIQPSESENRP